MKIFNTDHPSFDNIEIPNDHNQAAPVKEKTDSLAKQALYQASLAFTLAKNYYDSKTYEWWNPIKDTHIILGAIPLKNKGHHVEILSQVSQKANQPKLAVLTLLESFEIYTKGLLTSPVAPKTWKKLGVEQKIISAEDFNPLSQNEIGEAVDFLEKQHDSKVTTYVHCKAGRGRSATAVVCFLMKKFKHSAEIAKEIVRESRPQINLNSRQWEAVKTYEASL